MQSDFLNRIREDQFDAAHDPERGGLRLPALASVILERLDEAGAVSDGTIAYGRFERNRQTAEVHAYACDTEDDVLALFYVIDGNEQTPLGGPVEPGSVGKDEIDRGFRRLQNFVAWCAEPDLSVDESQPVSELIELVRGAPAVGLRLELNVLTTGSVSERAAIFPDVQKMPRHVWDLGRLMKTCGADSGERLSINFKDLYGSTLPCLVGPRADDGLQVFLTHIPGQVLADMYNTFRTRRYLINT